MLGGVLLAGAIGRCSPPAHRYQRHPLCNLGVQMISPQPDQQLQSKYVFVDTEAFIRANYDWGGKVLSKLAQFAKQGRLCLLTTAITKREVCQHLQERLTEAAAAARKHEVVLGQLGHSSICATLGDAAAIAKLEEAFETFLRTTQAIDVPIDVSVDEIFADYFAHRPPFGIKKKKAEFPDAVVIASLKAWCFKRNAKAYVVSGDPDMVECCSSSGPLLHAVSIEVIISQATVSQELHQALEHMLSESELLSDWLAEKLKDLTVVRGDMRLRRLSGRVDEVSDVNILSVNIVDRDGVTFTCEIEFEARLRLIVNVEQEEVGYGYDDYEPAQTRRAAKSVSRMFVAEVVVKFDPQKPDQTEFESVYVSRDNIELDVDDVRNR